jgi:hypothetical protein
MKTPEELEKRKSLNKKMLGFGCLPVIILFIVIGIFTPKDGSLEEINDKSAEYQEKIKTETEIIPASKIKTFNDPKELIYNLYKLGLGGFSEWKDLNDMDMGYFSTTPYFKFGPGEDYEKNLLIATLNSKKENYVQFIQIDLAIMNPVAYNLGLKKLSEVTEKAFYLTSEQIPETLSESIKSKKTGMFSFKNGVVEFTKLDENNKDKDWYSIKIIGN